MGFWKELVTEHSGPGFGLDLTQTWSYTCAWTPKKDPTQTFIQMTDFCSSRSPMRPRFGCFFPQIITLLGSFRCFQSLTATQHFQQPLLTKLNFWIITDYLSETRLENRFWSVKFQEATAALGEELSRFLAKTVVSSRVGILVVWTFFCWADQVELNVSAGQSCTLSSSLSSATSPFHPRGSCIIRGCSWNAGARRVLLPPSCPILAVVWRSGGSTAPGSSTHRGNCSGRYRRLNPLPHQHFADISVCNGAKRTMFQSRGGGD